MACEFSHENSASKECEEVTEDLLLCIKSVNDSVEMVYTTAAGVQEGLVIERMKRDKRILRLNAMKDWIQIGLQYEFHLNGVVKHIKEKYDGKLINWNIQFDEVGNIKTAEYGHDEIVHSELGAKYHYINGSMDIESSMGVIKWKSKDNVLFKVLNPEKTDSIHFFLLNNEYDIKWSGKCNQNQVLIASEIINEINPMLVRTNVFITKNDTQFVNVNFLKYEDMYPLLMKAPKIVVPKYLAEAVAH